jgi:hypothetical protein
MRPIGADRFSHRGMVVDNQQRSVAPGHGQELAPQLNHLLLWRVLFPQLYHSGATAHGGLNRFDKALAWDQLRIGDDVQSP